MGSSKQLDHLLESLRAISPMPSDEELERDPDRLDTYASLLDRLAAEIGDRFSPEAVSALAESFGSGEGFGTYWTALHLIEKSRSQDIYTIIRRVILEGPTNARAWCCFVLGRRRDPTDISLFLDLLTDDEPRTQYEALRALRALAQHGLLPDVAERIAPLVHHSTASVSRMAQEVLAMLGQ